MESRQLQLPRSNNPHFVILGISRSKSDLSYMKDESSGNPKFEHYKIHSVSFGEHRIPFPHLEMLGRDKDLKKVCGCMDSLM
jgi:hypothetical protein